MCVVTMGALAGLDGVCYATVECKRNTVIVQVTRSLRGTVHHFHDFSSVPHIETLSHIVTDQCSNASNRYSPLIVCHCLFFLLDVFLSLLK